VPGEVFMPHVIISIWKGRDAKMKKVLIEKVTDAITEAVSCPKEAVQVVVEEVEKENWGIGGVPASEKFPDRP